MISVHATPPPSLVGYMHPIREGLLSIREHTPHIVDLEAELQNIASGQYLTWIALDEDGSFAGYACTTPYQAGPNLFTHIIFMYTVPGKRGALKAMSDAICVYARSLQHYGVTFRTARNPKAWARMVKDIGAEVHLTEFLKRV